MRKRSLWITVLMIIFSFCFTMGLTACGGRNSKTEESKPIKYDTVTINNEVYLYFNNHYYKYFENALDWETAQYECEKIGGYLVTITSKDENKFIQSIINQDSWLGATDKKEEGKFVWVTGEEFSYSNWDSGEPNNIGGNQNYMQMYPEGKWDDDENWTSNYYVCEWDNKEDIGIPDYIYTSVIDSVEDLKGIAGKSETFILVNNIDLSEESNWKPIEDFTGTLIGGGYSITNLTISAVNVENIGLFGRLQGTVQDLKIENAQITARGDAGKAGIVAGTNTGKISNVTVSGNIAPEYYNNVGGLVGYNDCGTVINCTNQATVIGANSVGGIVGNMLVNKNEAITGCKNEGMITGKDNVGGIAGYINCVRSNATYQISNNSNKNTVTGNNRVGGVFGEVYAFYEYYKYDDYNSYFSMSVLTNEAEITGSSTGNDTGGLIGKATRLNLLTACENTADVSGGICVGGFVGYAPDTNIKATGAENNSIITGKGKVGGFAGQASVIENAVNNGDIISTGVMVEDGNSRAYVGGVAGYCTGLIGCENNIDIKIESNGSYVGGLAGYIIVSASNRVDNNVNYGTVTGYNGVGGIAGYLTCVRSNATYQVSNNENKSAITGNSQVGGIFGEVYAFYEYYKYDDYNSYFSMSVLTNSAEVVGSSTGNDTGGLIGRAARLTLLTTCENTANVTGGICVGGFVGYAPGTNIKATGTTNNSTITGNYKVGGFAGQAGVIEYAINSGEVFAIGRDSNGDTFAGGIAGYCTGIVGCINNMDISLSNAGKYVGGIAGYIILSDSNIVRENVNYGVIEGSDFVGGIAGYVTCVRSNATYRLTDNENKNTVNGKSCVGGIVGYVYAFYQRYNYSDYNSYFEIVNSINEAEIVGTEKVGGICGGYDRLKTDANLMDTNTTLYGEKLGQ